MFSSHSSYSGDLRRCKKNVKKTLGENTKCQNAILNNGDTSFARSLKFYKPPKAGCLQFSTRSEHYKVCPAHESHIPQLAPNVAGSKLLTVVSRSNPRLFWRYWLYGATFPLLRFNSYLVQVTFKRCFGLGFGYKSIY